MKFVIDMGARVKWKGRKEGWTFQRRHAILRELYFELSYFIKKRRI